MTIERHAAAALPPTLLRDDSEAAKREGERHARAMPMTRLLGNGMEYADALQLHALAIAGYPWPGVGEWLGDRNVSHAEASLAAGHRVSAAEAFRRAAACYRFAQSAYPRDNEAKRSLYAKLIAAFGRAVALAEPQGEHVEIPYRGAQLCAWLLRPAQPQPAPVVIVFGGADGWREEYQEAARALLARGVAVLLAELPGQGETRLMKGLYLDERVDEAVSAMVDALHADARLAPRVGIWGNSLGGTFAAFAASREPRLAACCVNGGSSTPTEVLERFPAILEKLEALVGPAARERATSIIASLSVTGATNRIACPLLVLHGEPDQIFLIGNARRLYEEAPSTDKRMLAWEDGEHCLYNHSDEKHRIVADWFADRLGAGTP